MTRFSAAMEKTHWMEAATMIKLMERMTMTPLMAEPVTTQFLAAEEMT